MIQSMMNRASLPFTNVWEYTFEIVKRIFEPFIRLSRFWWQLINMELESSITFWCGVARSLVRRENNQLELRSETCCIVGYSLKTFDMCDTCSSKGVLLETNNIYISRSQLESFWYWRNLKYDQQCTYSLH